MNIFPVLTSVAAFLLGLIMLPALRVLANKRLW